MSYMRFPLYAWTSSECEDDELINCTKTGHDRMHLWVRSGEHETVGALEIDHYGPDFEAGISIRGDLFDQLVLARFAEIVREDRLGEVVALATSPESPMYGNFGTSELMEALGRDPWAEFKQMIEADPEGHQE